MPTYNRHLFFAHPGGESEEEDFMVLKCAHMRRGPYHPPADMFETDDGLVARFEVAGCNAEDLHLAINETSLRLTGVRRDCCQKRKKSFTQMEIHYGNFERTLPLPFAVDIKNVVGHYKDGLLEVFMPRAVKPRVKRKTMVLKVRH